MKVILELTKEQAEKLVSILEDASDRGPPSAPYDSNELCIVRCIVTEAIEEAQGA